MIRRFPVAALAVLLLASASGAQSPEPDPKAMAAFKELVESYRARPALTVRSTVTVGLADGDAAGQGEEVTAELTWTREGKAVFKLRGFVCLVADGKLQVVHEKTDDKYFSMDDEGSPYYAIMNAFVDIPFPHLALALGEKDLEFLCMQLHPKAPWARPTAVSDAEVDGHAKRTITMTSDFEKMDIVVDRETGLIDSIDLAVTGGPLVQPGSTMTFKHRFEYETYEVEPLDPAFFHFDPGARQRVDLMAELSPAEPQGGQGPLTDKPAPPFVLATADGGAVDLEEMRGQVVVLDFWATWCGPCRRALPLLHEVNEWVKEQALPVRIVTVNVFEASRGGEDTPDRRLDAVRAFWDQNKFTLPVAMDFTDETAAAYGVQGIPATFVIRSDGVIHAQHTGAGENYVDTLKEDILGAIAALEAAGDE